MKFRDLLKLSTRTFRTRAGRTALTILGTSIGIGAILIFVSLGYGLQKITLDQITTSESLLSLDIATPSEDIFLDAGKIKEISSIENVDQVSPLAIIPGQIVIGELTSGASFYACQPLYFKLGGIMAQEGNLFETEKERNVVISSAMLRSFNLESAQALGKEIKVTLYKNNLDENDNESAQIFEIKEPYKILGIIEDETASYAYIPLNSLTDIEISEFSQAKVKVSQTKAIEQVSEKISGMGYLVSALSETIDEANKIFGAIQITLAAFGLVALLVGAIGMANTMTVTLLERTNEIGIMKAIGAEDSDIGVMFLTESVIMGFLGGVGGIIIGFLSSWIFNEIINMLARSLGGQAVSLFYTPLWFAIFIIFFSTAVGLFSGIFPAKKASQLNPLEALRYK